MPDVHSFGIDPITCYCWNQDHTQLALSMNNNEVQIQNFSGGKWSLKSALTDHTQRVTGIDWAPKSNRIVTCAADRNAYVWVLESGKWTPTLVVLGITRAATCVKWSPMENKFAVGSGNRCIAICSYDKENNWWTSKKIKKSIRSTVTCLDWHPNNYLIACGSTDFKARVFSAYIKEAEDEKPVPTNWGSSNNFANLMGEFSSETGGWVHGISFSASGNLLAWVAHDASVCVVDANRGLKLTIMKTEYLPFMDVTWINESSIIVAGYGCVPMRFNYKDSLTFAGKLDDTDSKQQPGKVSAMAQFKAMDSRAATDIETALNSIHQNTIVKLSIFAGGKERCTKLSSVGTDGQIVNWDIK